MKYFISITFLFSFLIPCLNAQEIKIEKSKYNFGFVHEGDTVSMAFVIRNIGNLPLVISNYNVECRCTSMEIPKEPIKPGEAYTLKVTFDTHEKYDRQDRTVTLISNSVNPPNVLRFKGVVLKPK